MTRDPAFDIAVTGLAARFPGAPDVDSWWSAVKAGRVLTTRYDRAELLAAGVPSRLVEDPDYVPVRGHLDGADRFDAALFRVAARDAELMDPQQRLMLEVAWSALEDAGAAPLQEGPVTGVYASMSGSGYVRGMLVRGDLDPLTLDRVIHGTEPEFGASRIAYKLGLTGPALAVQTACSSSLVGVHLAMQGLVAGECDQALVVGAGMGWPQAGHLHAPGGVLSPSGDCRPFDAAADGVVAGSGVACVVLRRLADALDVGADPYGVILGSAINNDGAAKAGYYAPSVDGQAAVIRAALEAADVDGDSVGYLETHGTGTRVGDPIEWLAASKALAGSGAAPRQVAVGALKANVGHLDAAAGVSALIKALLVVRDGVVPPVAGFFQLNPLLETDGSPLYVPTGGPWVGPQPRRAGVSAFGIGGTNAHVLIEQPPARPSSRPANRPRLVVLSGGDDAAVSRAAVRLSGALNSANHSLADVAGTLVHGRALLPARLAVAGSSTAEVADRLATGDVVQGTARPAPVVFAFPGQGTQRPGMAVPFLALPGFGAALDRCLDAVGDDRVRRAVLDPGFPAAELQETELAQPALFAVEHAAAVALIGLGVRPAAVLGHSLGELTAVCVAGVLDLADAARFIAARGRALQACAPGAMLAIGADEDQTRTLLAQSGLELDVAAINGPHACVVAGAADEVEKFRAWVGDAMFTRLLPTSRAFHSALVEPAVPELAAALANTVLHPPQLPVGSGVLGGLLPAVVEPRLLAEQARHPVRYADALAAVLDRVPDAVVVEVGPGRTLAGLCEMTGVTGVPLCGDDGDAAALTGLGRLWTLGQPVDLAALAMDGRVVHLPTYPFAGPAWLAPELRRPHPDTVSSVPASDIVTASIPDVHVEIGGVVPSRETVAKVVARLWRELLGPVPLSDDSDFFALGGDSLLVTHLARRIRQELRVQVPLHDLMAGRTLDRQTAAVLALSDSQEATA